MHKDIFNQGITSKSDNTFVGLQGYESEHESQPALNGWSDLWDTISSKAQDGLETIFTTNVDDYVQEKTSDPSPLSAEERAALAEAVVADAAPKENAFAKIVKSPIGLGILGLVAYSFLT